MTIDHLCSSFFVEIHSLLNSKIKLRFRRLIFWSPHPQITGPTKYYRPLFCILLTFTTAPSYLFTSQVIWEIFFELVHIKMFVVKKKHRNIYDQPDVCQCKIYIVESWFSRYGFWFEICSLWWPTVFAIRIMSNVLGKVLVINKIARYRVLSCKNRMIILSSKCWVHIKLVGLNLTTKDRIKSVFVFIIILSL